MHPSDSSSTIRLPRTSVCVPVVHAHATVRFAVDARRRLARMGTRHAPHAPVDGDGVGVAHARPAEGRRAVDGGRLDVKGARGRRRSRNAAFADDGRRGVAVRG